MKVNWFEAQKISPHFCGLSPDISCLGYRSDLATFWEVDRVSGNLEGMAIGQIEGANCLSKSPLFFPHLPQM